jgi:hypothetical protein
LPPHPIWRLFYIKFLAKAIRLKAKVLDQANGNKNAGVLCCKHEIDMVNYTATRRELDFLRSQNLAFGTVFLFFARGKKVQNLPVWSIANMNQRESRYVRIARIAYRLTQKVLPKYSHPKSPHRFELPQLAACVLLMFYLNLNFAL